MLFFRVLEVIFIIFVGWALITQIIVPAYKGTTLFKSFRKEGTLENTLADLERNDRELDAQAKVNAKAKAVAKKAKKVSNS